MDRNLCVSVLSLVGVKVVEFFLSFFEIIWFQVCVPPCLMRNELELLASPLYLSSVFNNEKMRDAKSAHKMANIVRLNSPTSLLRVVIPSPGYYQLCQCHYKNKATSCCKKQKEISPQFYLISWCLNLFRWSARNNALVFRGGVLDVFLWFLSMIT